MDIKLTQTGHDLDLRANDLQLVAGQDCTAQVVKINWLSLAGEWFLDDERGVWRIPGDFKQKQTEARQAQLRTRLERAALNVAGVLACVIRSFSLDRATRRLAVTAVLTVDSGDAVPVVLDQVVA